MKIFQDLFKGVAPRVSPKKLPEGFARKAVNCRFLSGSVGSWYDWSLEDTLPKAGTVNRVYGMDVDGSDGGPFWLHWVDSELGTDQVCVDVAKGPIQGDDTERTYFTGTDAPRVTNLELATTGAATEEYPYGSYLLGIPSPDDAPVLSVVPGSAEDEIELVNPDAETGDVSGWTINSGQFDVHTTGDVAGLDPYEGDYYFYLGTTAATSEIQQLVDLETLGVVIGQPITLSWQQATGNDGSTATIGFVAYDSSDNVVQEYFNDEFAPVDPFTWVEQSLVFVTPEDTSYVALVIRGTKVGTGEVDAYIDDITLTVNPLAEAYDGSSLAGWRLSTEYDDNSITVDDTLTAFPTPCWQFRGRGGTVSYMYRDINLTEYTSCRIRFRMGWKSTEAGERLSVSLGASSTGASWAFTLDREEVRLGQTASWGSKPSTMQVIAGISQTSNLVDPDSPYVTGPPQVYDVDLGIVNRGNGIAELTVSLKNVYTNTQILEDVVYDIDLIGDYIGLQGWSFATNSADELQVDNFSIEAEGRLVGTETETTVVNYVYTLVNEFEEEGPPSDVSLSIQKSVLADVVVSTGTTATSGYGIVNKRIYRTVTGIETTDYYFVTEIPLEQADFTDNLSDSELGEVLQTVDWDLPPSDGHSILALPNGITVMASGNDVRPSVQSRPHAYPVAYSLSTDYPIVGMGAVETMVVVLTQSHPYAVIGSSPESLSMAKFDKPQGCVSKRSIVSIRGLGVVYASTEGLFSISGVGVINNLTQNLFTRREWEAIGPENLVSFTHDGRYYGMLPSGYTLESIPEESSTTVYGFVLDPAEGTLTWLDKSGVVAGFSNPIDDQLYLCQDHSLYQWEGSASLLEYYYRSKVFSTPMPTSFEFCRLTNDHSANLTVRLYTDDSLVYTKSVSNSEEFILPATEGTYWEYSLQGTTLVDDFDMVTDAMELT